MVDVATVHRRSIEGYQAALADELATYRRAELAHDVDECARSAQQIAALRATMRELDSMAQEAWAASQPSPDANRYGLNKDEIDVANGMFTGDPRLSNDDRQRIYAEQRQRYRHARATGAYRDDQGYVRR